MTTYHDHDHDYNDHNHNNHRDRIVGGALLLIAFGYRMEKRTEDWLQNGQDVGEGLSAEERINQLPLIARLTSRSVRRHSDSFVH